MALVDLTAYIPPRLLSNNALRITPEDGYVKTPTLLGSGGFGIVMKYINTTFNPNANNVTNKTQFAIAAGKELKITFAALNANDDQLRREAIESFLHELEILCSIPKQHSEYITRFIGYSCGPQELVIFMECFEGKKSIRDAMKATGGPFSPEISLKYFYQIAKGLEYLHHEDLPHKHRIIHRDLKCANVMLTDDGSCVKLADFGLAFQLAVDSQSVTLSTEAPRDVCGTATFMAPEVLLAKKYGRRSDIWSLACTLVEMLTTNPPHVEIYAKHKGQAFDVFLQKARAAKHQQLQYDGKMFFPAAVLPPPEICLLLDCLFTKSPQQRPVVDSVLNVLKITSNTPLQVEVDVGKVTALKNEIGQDRGCTVSMFKKIVNWIGPGCI